MSIIFSVTYVPWWLDSKASAYNAGDLGVRSLGQEDSLEKEMATHSSNLPWKIPWMEEPGRLQSVGLQRVGHDRVTKQQQHIKLLTYVPQKRYLPV